MPILAMSAGTVVAIRGAAFLRLPDGTMQPLAVGDKVKGGQHIVTDDASWVQISPDPDATPRVAAPAAPVTPVDQAIAAIENDEEAPAAGLTGGGGGGLQPGLRVDRVQEGVTPLAYDYNTARGPADFPIGSTADQRALPDGDVTQPPVLDLDGDNSTATGTSYQGAATDVGGPVPVVDADALITDGDSTQMSGATLTLTNLKAGDVLDFGNMPPGITATLSPDGTTVTLSGTASLADYQNALKAITFEATAPVADTTPRQIAVTVTDPQGNTSNTAISTINVSVVPPVLSINAKGVVEGNDIPFVVGLSKPSSEAITVKLTLANGTDVSGTPQNESATVGVDTATQLQYQNSSGAWVNVPASGEVTFAAGQTQINLRLSTVDDKEVEPTEFVRLTAEVVTGSTQNANAAIEAEIRDNDTPPPVLDLDGDDSTAPGTSYAGNATDTGGPVPVVDPDVSITDADSTQMSGATLTLTNAKAGDVLDFGNMPPGITATLSANGTTVTLSGTASLADYQNALKAVTFEATAPVADTTPRQIAVTVTDPQGNVSNTAISTINVSVVPPVLNIFSPGAEEGSPLSFVAALSKPSNEPVTIKLSLANGTDVPSTPENESATVGVDTGTQLEYEAAPGVWEPVPANGELTFAPGQTQINLRLATVDDQAIEADEFVRLTADVTTGNTQNTQAINEAQIRDDDTAPTVSAPTVSVSEEGLSGGQKDDQGVPSDNSDSAVIIGQIDVADQDGDAVTLTVGAPTTPVFVLGSDTPVVWSSDGDGGWIGRTTTDPTSPVVATMAVEPSGAYTFTLNMPLQHPAQGEDLLPISFPVTVSDGVNSASTTLTIQVEDDAPVPTDINREVAALDTNLLIVLDTSSSMRSDSGIGDLTRLQAAVKAVGELLDRYDDVGNVRVRLVTFNSVADTLGDGWVTVSEAKALLSAVQLSGQTNYDLALDKAMEAYATSSGKLSNAQSVSYFLSDGNPTLSRENPESGVGRQNGSLAQPSLGDGIGASEEAAWQAFLRNNNIKSYAIGMGEDVEDTFLNPIAYDGHAVVDMNSVVVSDLTQLEQVFNSTATEFAVGNLGTTGSVGSVMGADGFQRVEKLVVDGVTYLFDTAQPERVITTALGGTLTVNMQTGDYRYAAAPNVVGVQNETIEFTLSDRDGDQATSQLVIEVDKATVVSGTAGADTLTGAAAADVIYAGAGDDIVSAGAGNDLVYGGQGNDRLHGGAGNDILVGGPGSDVFEWRLGDALPAGSTASAPVDVIRDFDGRAPADGGDVLDLRDLLQGENTAGGTGNLDSFLRFEQTGSDTVIHISHTGGFDSSGAGAETQRIVLQGVDLRADLGLSDGAGDLEVIAKLLDQNKLIVDPTS